MCFFKNMLFALGARFRESRRQNRQEQQLLKLTTSRIALRETFAAAETLMLRLILKKYDYDLKQQNFHEAIENRFAFVELDQFNLYVHRFNLINLKYILMVKLTLNDFNEKLLLGMKEMFETDTIISPLLKQQNSDADLKNKTIEEVGAELERTEEALKKATELRAHLTALQEEYVTVVKVVIDSDFHDCIQEVNAALQDIKRSAQEDDEIGAYI